MKALTVDSTGTNVIIHDLPLPEVRSTYMLVKTAAVTVNPADNIVLEYGLVKSGHNFGCDWAGTVVSVGPDVERSFKPGDRVCGMSKPTDGERSDVGVFAEYIVVKADLALHIPDHMSFTDAAPLGIVTVTAGRWLFDKFRIPYPTVSADGTLSPPTTRPRQILIYGGSTAMGTMTIQYAKLAGFFVISTASPHNKSLVSSYGADAVLDHYSPTAPSEILAIAAHNSSQYGPLTLCLDCIGLPSTTHFCSQILTPASPPPDPSAPPDFFPSEQDIDLDTHVGKIYGTLTPLTPPFPFPDNDDPKVRTVRTLGYSFLNEPYDWLDGRVVPASRAAFEEARDFAVLAERLLKLKIVRPHPVEVRAGGLEGVMREGLLELRAGRVSGRKLVFSPL